MGIVKSIMTWVVLSGTHHLGPLDENHERTIACRWTGCDWFVPALAPLTGLLIYVLAS
jgi:hypothetical protein